MTAIEATTGDELVRALNTEGATLPKQELRALVQKLSLETQRGEFRLSDFWAAGAMHQRTEVRLAIVQEAAGSTDDDEARELLAWAVNDADDRIAVAAMLAVAQRGDLDAIDELFDAAGRSMSAISGISATPCDLRRRTTLASLDRLVRAHPDRDAELSRLSWSGYGQPESVHDQVHHTEGMVEIAPGLGARYPFFIDVTPVTWRDFAVFVRAEEDSGPIWRHPGQPADYYNNVLQDLDTGQLDRVLDHPVTGVSWFDAWAFASWRGKRLPTAAQWEQAAGMSEGLTYPWGNAEPTAAHANFADDGPVDLGARLSERVVERLTSAVDTHRCGASPSGVQDMAGNVWEWTRTRQLDHQEINPYVGVARYAETLGNWTLSACVMGGSWASEADDLAMGVRAGKHVLQRGPETGFRCVVESHGE